MHFGGERRKCERLDREWQADWCFHHVYVRVPPTDCLGFHMFSSSCDVTVSFLNDVFIRTYVYICVYAVS